MSQPDAYSAMGLSQSEFERIVHLLGREPTLTELGMFAAMWSEHCGYKYSRPVLSRFGAYRAAQQSGALENAGVIPLDDKLAIVFKVESHNHPSAVEPFEGAATGVGGILRDVFTMGARPIALLDSLRFGPLDDARSRYLFEHVVAGIGHYGNSVGVPTVAGEVYFHPCYGPNPIVNAMAVGIVDRDRVARAAAEGVGNPVLYVGSATGRDGIHGATFASVELGPDSGANRPNVQIGDPFQEKLLIEATLEALATGAIAGIQDMGAAGLTCSTCEMASRAGTGVEIDIRNVPTREADMTPYEIVLSESQERMLCVVRRGEEEKVLACFRKWELPAVVIGHVTDDGLVRVTDNGVVVACIRATALTSECPTYYVDACAPSGAGNARTFDRSKVPEPADYNEVLMTLLGSPNIASKEWVTEQYDRSVQTQTVAMRGLGAAVLRVRGSQKGIAVKLDGNARYCHLDPFVGAQIAVAEAARNVVCTGARPAGVTDCLNFASPESPEGFWQFERVVDGIVAATEALGIPVVSGNVSFYNETAAGGIFPTPVIGMVGILDDVSVRCDGAFRQNGEGDQIVLLSPYADGGDGLDGSEYVSLMHGSEEGVPPHIDLDGERRLHDLTLDAIREGWLSACADVSEGGLATCLAEMAITGERGAAVLLRPSVFGRVRRDAALFGESQGRIIATLRSEHHLKELERRSVAAGVSMTWIGTVGGDRLRIASGQEVLIDREVSALADAWRHAISGRMEYATYQETRVAS